MPNRIILLERLVPYCNPTWYTGLVLVPKNSNFPLQDYWVYFGREALRRPQLFGPRKILGGNLAGCALKGRTSFSFEPPFLSKEPFPQRRFIGHYYTWIRKRFRGNGGLLLTDVWPGFYHRTALELQPHKGELGLDNGVSSSCPPVRLTAGLELGNLPLFPQRVLSSKRGLSFFPRTLQEVFPVPSKFGGGH